MASFYTTDKYTWNKTWRYSKHALIVLTYHIHTIYECNMCTHIKIIPYISTIWYTLAPSTMYIHILHTPALQYINTLKILLWDLKLMQIHTQRYSAVDLWLHMHTPENGQPCLKHVMFNTMTGGWDIPLSHLSFIQRHWHVEWACTQQDAEHKKKKCLKWLFWWCAHVICMRAANKFNIWRLNPW
jgi:hypothetical protein